MCQTLNVGETGYYKFKRNPEKSGKDAVFSASIKEILGESPYNDNYGVPRMQPALNQSRKASYNPYNERKRLDS